MSARNEGFLEMRLAEIERRLASVVRVGTVAELNDADALARVESGDLLLDWLPWAQRRLGSAREYWAPVVGEQVLVLSPGGDSRLGVITMSIASDANPMPASSADVHRVEYSNGSSVQYDGSSGTFELVAKGDVLLDATGNLEAKATGNVALEAGGNLEAKATGNVKLDASAAVEINATASIKLSAPSITLDSPSITLGGTVSVTGPLSGPSASFSTSVTAPSGTFAGSLSALGACNLGPLTTIGGVPYKAHVHVSTGPGLPTTPPVV